MQGVKIMFMTHVVATARSPITHHEFPVVKYRFDIKDLDDEEVTTKCFEEFKNCEEGKLYGSVHVEPHCWTQFYIGAMCNAQQHDEEVAKVPNGCCNMPQCGIKKYYEIVHNYYNSIDVE